MRAFYALLLNASLLSSPLVAQYTIKNIVFINPGAYARPDLLTLTGLKVGDSLDKPGLGAASARLAATGYFENVEASVDGPFKAIDVRFKLKPADPSALLPVGLENFVWFTPEELRANLEKSVPLFTHGVAEGSSQEALVQAALEAMLAGRSITGTISHQIVVPSPGYPRRALEYRIESPSVRLGAAKLTGISPEMAPAMRVALTTATHSAYNEGLAGVTTADQILTPYRDAGYLDATLENVRRSVSANDQTIVKADLSAEVVPGELYHVSTLDFAGTSVVSPAAFASTAKLHPHDLASRRNLLASLAPVTAAYHSQGYMDAYVDAAAARDAATHQVAYTVTVLPGEVYRLGSIHVTDLPAAPRADFDKAFRLHPGDVYDEVYVGSFLTNNTAVRSLDNYAAAFTASSDPATHLVELEIKFVAGGARTR